MKQLVLIKVYLVRLERTLIALPEGLSSSFNIHIVVQNGLAPVLKNPKPSSGLHGHYAHMVCRQNTYTYEGFKNFLKVAL